MHEYWLDPPEDKPVKTCSYCGQDMFAGEDSWVIKNDVFCECCIDSFREEIEEIDYEYEKIAHHHCA